MIAQKYRISWSQQEGLSPTVNRGLGQQFANIDEMLETLFTETKRTASLVISGGIGNVSGPAGATDDAIALFDGTTGNRLQDSGVLLSSLATTHHHTTHELGGSDAITIAQSQVTDLTTDLAAKAPLNHHTSHEPGGSDVLQLSAASRLFGRGSSGAGALEEIDLGANLTMTGTTLAAASHASSIADYMFSAATSAPPGADQIRFDAGSPYTAVTKVWIRTVTSDGIDIYHVLKLLPVGSRLVVQDKNDHTQYVYFTITAAPIDNTTYFEIPVTHVAHGGALSGGQPVLVQNLTQAQVGDVLGPAGATADALALFDGTTGKLIKDSTILLATLAPLASPALTGTPTAPTAGAGTNTTQLATTAFVTSAVAVAPPTAHHTTHESGGSDVLTLAQSQITNLVSDLALKAPLASPALTGTPTAPTASGGTNTTQVATTAFANAAATAAAAAILPISLTTQVTGTLQAAQEPAHTGDVTNSAGSLALAIGAGKVTNTMLAGSITAAKLVQTDIVLAESQVTNLTTDLAAKVVGPSSATDEAVARFDTTSGKLLQDSRLTLTDAGVLTLTNPTAEATINLIDSSNATNQKRWLVRVATNGAFIVNAMTDAGAILATPLVMDVAGQIVSPALSGTPTAPTATSGTNTTQLATTAFVQTEIAPKAPLASPALTGTPTVPTASAATNTTQAASTAFVQTAISPASVSWTPVDVSGDAITFAAASGTYIVLGKLVFFHCGITWPTISSGGGTGVKIGGLPFTSAVQAAVSIAYTELANVTHGLVQGSQQYFFLYLNTNAQPTNISLSAKTVIMSGFYFRS